MPLIWFLFTIYLSQHVSDIIMPIVRRTRMCSTAYGVVFYRIWCCVLPHMVLCSTAHGVVFYRTWCCVLPHTVFCTGCDGRCYEKLGREPCALREGCCRTTEYGDQVDFLLCGLIHPNLPYELKTKRISSEDWKKKYKTNLAAANAQNAIIAVLWIDTRFRRKVLLPTSVLNTKYADNASTGMYGVTNHMASLRT
jgi:hypothetical protein